jgi:hypothetical protein
MPHPRRPHRFRAFIFVLPALILACSLFGAEAGGSPAAQPSPTRTAAGERNGPSGTVDTSADTAEPAETSSPTPTFTIVHLATPPGSAGTTRFITDIKTKDYAPQKKAVGGDEYHNNRWERPFTAEEMEYLSDVDLIRVEMKIADPWVYITFEFVEPRAEGVGQTLYGAEFDLNKDGRGEYLAWGASPPSGEWTTDGVEVWQDTNFDVGGPVPQQSDAPWLTGDGYDKNLVSSGRGADPDLAWIRQIEGGAKVQLAFKYSVLNNASQFLWNGLADAGVRNPAWLDYNDHFTQKEAGSPLPVQTTFYPLKELWGIDNTCRDPFGFTPTGNEAGICLYTGTISGTVFRDQGAGNPPATVDNGIFDANEPVMVGTGPVNLGQGACPSTGYLSTTTGGAGTYSFAGIPIGAYCVNFDLPLPTPLYYLTTPIHVTVNLGPGETEVVNFGINWTNPDIPEPPK